MGILTKTTSEIQAILNSIVDPSTGLATKISVSAVTTALNLKANIASPTFTGFVGGLTKEMVGLGNVDNTSDAAKPIPNGITAQLNLKADILNPTFTGTVSGITKAMVGLPLAENTTDLDKVVSTLTQTQLNLKAPLVSPTFTGTVGGITKAMVGLPLAENTTDLGKVVSTLTQTQLDLKAPLASPTFTGTATFANGSLVNQYNTLADVPAGFSGTANINNRVFDFLNGKILSKANATTCVVIGDSRVAQASGEGGNSGADKANGWYVHLQSMTNGRLWSIFNAGVSGDTTTKYLARFDTDVIARAPDWCLMMSTVNDINVTTPVGLETSKSNVITMWQRCLAANIKFAVGTISPWGTFTTATKKEYHAAYNRWIKSWAAKNGIPCADEYATTANAATGGFLTPNMYNEGDSAYGHYSDYGASLVARAWFDVLDPLLPQNHLLTRMAYDYDNLIWNGNGGWTVGASLPTGWTVSGSAASVGSVVARADIFQGSLMQLDNTASVAATQGQYMALAGPSFKMGVARATTAVAVTLGDRKVFSDGNQYVCTTAGTQAASEPVMNSAVGATTVDSGVTWTRYENFNVGDTVYFEVEYFTSNISGGNLGFCAMVYLQTSGGAEQRVRVPSNQTAGTYPKVAQEYIGKGVLRTKPFVIPVGATGYNPLIAVFLDATTVGKFQVGCIAMKHYY